MTLRFAPIHPQKDRFRPAALEGPHHRTYERAQFAFLKGYTSKAIRLANEAATMAEALEQHALAAAWRSAARQFAGASGCGVS